MTLGIIVLACIQFRIQFYKVTKSIEYIFIKNLFFIHIFTVPVSHIAWHDNLVPFAVAFSSGAITVGKIQTRTEPEILTICQVIKC